VREDADLTVRLFEAIYKRLLASPGRLRRRSTIGR
jgi:hypothetical protein